MFFFVKCILHSIKNVTINIGQIYSFETHALLLYKKHDFTIAVYIWFFVETAWEKWHRCDIILPGAGKSRTELLLQVIRDSAPNGKGCVTLAAI